MFHRMIPVGLAACLAVFASGCAGRLPEVSKPLQIPAPEPQGKPPEPVMACPPLPPRLRMEIAALTPVTPDMTRQLILSEIEQHFHRHRPTHPTHQHRKQPPLLRRPQIHQPTTHHRFHRTQHPQLHPRTGSNPLRQG